MRIKWIVQTVILFVFALGIGVGGYAVYPNATYAQDLVDRVSTSDHILSIAKPNEAVYYTSLVYRRTNPAITEPLDPYHLPVLPFYRDKHLIEHWVTHDGFVETGKLYTNQTRILHKTVETSKTSAFYDAINGFAVVSEPKVRSNSDLTDIDAMRRSWISGEHESSWGASAWIVDFDPYAASPEDYQAGSQKLADPWQAPFAADLAFDHVQWEWAIDQASELLVSKSLVAVTKSGPVVLYSETRSQPETLPVSALPKDLDQLPDEAFDALVPVDLPSTTSLHGDTRTPEEVAMSLDYPVYLPDERVLSELQQPLNRKILFSGNNGSNRVSPLSFEMTDVSMLGLGIKTIYLSDSPIDPEHPQALVVVQAPSVKVVEKLENSLPTWQESRPAVISINGVERNGWLLSGGLLREAGNNPLLGFMYETDETLIYVEGQNMSEQELRQIVSNLKRINQELPVQTGQADSPD